MDIVEQGFLCAVRISYICVDMSSVNIKSDDLWFGQEIGGRVSQGERVRKREGRKKGRGRRKGKMRGRGGGEEEGEGEGKGKGQGKKGQELGEERMNSQIDPGMERFTLEDMRKMHGI